MIISTIKKRLFSSLQRTIRKNKYQIILLLLLLFHQRFYNNPLSLFLIFATLNRKNLKSNNTIRDLIEFDINREKFKKKKEEEKNFRFPGVRNPENEEETKKYARIKKKEEK